MLTVDSLGELHLPDGRVLGNRIYKTVYRQNLRPDESREAVLVNQKMIEDRLLSNHLAHYKGGKFGISDIVVATREAKRANKIQRDQHQRAQGHALHVGIKANKLQTHFKYRDPLV